MRKTSVYLPDGLKRDLAGLAARSGRSEAELIRTAIERLVHGGADTRPAARPPTRSPLTGPHLVGVGVGPGDPELVTTRAVAVLAAADRIVAASTGPQAIGRAESVVRAAVAGVSVDRVTIDIAGSPAERDASLAAAAAEIVGWLDEGETVAFATLGDPNLFSTFPALARAVHAERPAVPIGSVPGVMAFQELAAQTGTVVADDPTHTVLLAARDDVGPFEVGLADPACAVVLCKGGAGLPDIARRLEERGRLDGAVVGELLGLPGGRSVPVADVADRPASYLASVVVPARRAAPPPVHTDVRANGRPRGRT